MAACTEAHPMERVISLGGRGDKNNAGLCHHLPSRHEVEAILCNHSIDWKVPICEVNRTVRKFPLNAFEEGFIGRDP